MVSLAESEHDPVPGSSERRHSRRERHTAVPNHRSGERPAIRSNLTVLRVGVSRRTKGYGSSKEGSRRRSGTARMRRCWDNRLCHETTASSRSCSRGPTDLQLSVMSSNGTGVRGPRPLARRTRGARLVAGRCVGCHRRERRWDAGPLQGPRLRRCAVRLVDGEAVNPIWSPDGRHILYNGPIVAGSSALLAIQPDGTPLSMPPVQVQARRPAFCSRWRRRRVSGRGRRLPHV